MTGQKTEYLVEEIAKSCTLFFLYPMIKQELICLDQGRDAFSFFQANDCLSVVYEQVHMHQLPLK